MSSTPLNFLDLDQLQFNGDGPRFVMAGEEDGLWTVVDQLTMRPAIWNDQMLFGLTFDQADDLVETMNLLLLDPNLL